MVPWVWLCLSTQMLQVKSGQVTPQLIWWIQMGCAFVFFLHEPVHSPTSVIILLIGVCPSLLPWTFVSPTPLSLMVCCTCPWGSGGEPGVKCVWTWNCALAFSTAVSKNCCSLFTIKIVVSCDDEVGTVLFCGTLCMFGVFSVCWNRFVTSVSFSGSSSGELRPSPHRSI